MSETIAIPTSVDGLAGFWRVNPRTIIQWRSEAAPLHNVEELAVWATKKKRLPQGFVARLGELRAPSARGESGVGADGRQKATDWETFEKTARTDDPNEAMVKIAKARDFASYKFELAAKKGDAADLKFYGDLLAKMEGVLHDAQLRAKKLGLDEGDLIPRVEVERILWSVGYWLMRAADLNLDALSSRLEAMAPGLSGKAVRKALEGELLSDRFLVPFARAASIQAGVTVPEWAVAPMRKACGDYLEDGEKAFDAYKAP